MKYFYQATMVTGLVTALALPAYAASDSMDATMMTCADFTAMDADGQMKAMETMKMASDEMASDEMMAIASACEDNPDMMAMDAMMSK